MPEGAIATIPRIRLEMKPDAESLPRLLGPKFDQLPFVVLVMGDLVQRDDPRPIEDRKPLGITRDTFDKRMAEQKLAVEIAGEANVTVRFRRLADFEPEALARQLSSLLPENAIPAALTATFADTRVTALERMWRSIRMLVDQAGDQAAVEIVNASTADLAVDFEDAPELTKSGLHRLIHHYNHLGMRPYSALVLADDLGPRALMIREISDIARSGSLAVLVSTAEPLRWKGVEAWEAGEASRFVARCGPAFIVAQAHAHRPRLEGRGAFLAGALMLRSHAETLTGCHFASREIALSGVDLAEGSDGTVVFSADNGSVRAVRDQACHRGADARARSLSLLVLGNRIIHEALNVQWKRGLFPDPGAADCVERMNAGLAVRLEGSGLIARVEPLPRDPKKPALHPQELTVSLAGDGGAPLLVRRFDLPDSA